MTPAQHEAALARAVALARRVSAWLMFDNPNADGRTRAHVRLLDEFAADPFGEPSNLADLLDQHDAESDALCRAENERDERARVAEATWQSIVDMVQPEGPAVASGGHA